MIDKEKENLRLIKLKNAQTMDKKKIYFNLKVKLGHHNLQKRNYVFQEVN